MGRHGALPYYLIELISLNMLCARHESAPHKFDCGTAPDFGILGVPRQDRIAFGSESPHYSGGRCRPANCSYCQGIGGLPGHRQQGAATLCQIGLGRAGRRSPDRQVQHLRSGNRETGVAPNGSAPSSRLLPLERADVGGHLGSEQASGVVHSGTAWHQPGAPAALVGQHRSRVCSGSH